MLVEILIFRSSQDPHPGVLQHALGGASNLTSTAQSTDEVWGVIEIK